MTRERTQNAGWRFALELSCGGERRSPKGTCVARRTLCGLPLHAKDGIRSRFDLLPLPKVGDWSELPEISATPGAAVQGIRAAFQAREHR